MEEVEYNSKKHYLIKLTIIFVICISIQIAILYILDNNQIELDNLNQLDDNCNLKSSVVTVIKKTIPNTENTDFKECLIINSDDPTYTSDNLKNDINSKKSKLVTWNAINFIVGVFNTITAGLLTTIVLIPSNELIFSK